MMGKWGSRVLLMLALLAGMASCQKDDADRIVGKWQLRDLKYKEVYSETIDSVFYNFQKGTFSAIRLRRSGEYKTFFGSYSMRNSEISVTLYLDSIEKKELYEDVRLSNSDNEYVIKEITSSDMTLSLNDTLMYFRKY